MRVPLSWLGEYVDVELSPEALAERLTLLGMEVKGIERRGTDWRNVVVGELLSVEQHPRADRLSLTRVTKSLVSNLIWTERLFGVQVMTLIPVVCKLQSVLALKLWKPPLKERRKVSVAVGGIHNSTRLSPEGSTVMLSA